MEQLLKEKLMAEQLRISSRTLRGWRARRLVPSIRIGKIIFYSPQDVVAALKERTIEAQTNG